MHFDSFSAKNDYDKAKLFNKYFHSIFTQSSFTLPPISEIPSVVSLISDIFIPESDVFSELSLLDTSKTMGIDNMGPKILKFCAPALYLPIHHLFPLSLSSQRLPTEWCTHSITPIFKFGYRASTKNYRPISFLCTISQVLERIIYSKIIPVVFPKFSPYQFGFTKNRSTVHQLLIFLNHVLDSFEIKAQRDVIYLDFKKAFDSVPHNELLLKLWNIGITRLWFKAYLTSRNQVVSVNKAFSDSLPVLSGVHQSSILGLLLFLIFINDLHQSNRCSSLLLFADDAKCFRMIQLQSDLSRLSNWSNHWKLSFNELKCTLIHFSANSPEFIENFTLNQHQFSVSNSCKVLGVILTSNLDFSDHYTYISG